MINGSLIKRILWPNYPKFPNCRQISFEWLLSEGLTMGTLYIGRQGTGKTSSLARHLVDYFKAYPDRAIFVLDWSGSISDSILSLILREPNNLVQTHLKRIVYDELGNPEWVIPMPEFSPLYGGTYEEQVQRVAQNLAKLAPELVKDAPFLAGLGLREIAPQIFRLLTSVADADGRTWQVTEAKRLLTDEKLLRATLLAYGNNLAQGSWFLKNVFLEIKRSERELRSYALLAMLGTVESPETKARVGFHRPGWTPREAIDGGLMVLVNGARLINQRNAQHYLFTQVYSLIMSEINKRIPGDPADKPVALVMDEVYSLLSIPGMAAEVGMLAPLYRSRKLELYIVLQALSQLADNLKEQIWSIGNIVSFAISNFQEAYEVSQQIFPYDPNTIKLTARSETGQPIVEPDRGQYLQIANYLQRLKHRECIMRRYASERVLEKNVSWVEKTKELPNHRTELTLEEAKETLLRERAVRVSDALEVIDKRTIRKAGGSPAKPPTI